MPTRQRLAGREAELRLLAGLNGEAPSQGKAILLVGQPGIAKTSLLRAAAQLARAMEFVVVETAGVELEALLPYAGLHQLLRPVLGTASALPTPLRRALLTALGEDDGPSQVETSDDDRRGSWGARCRGVRACVWSRD